jgi:hypothetical protein
MATQKQITAQLKKERNEIKRGIVARVTTAALHIIHDSQMRATSLWPEDDVVAHSTSTFDYDDIIDVQVLINYNEDGLVHEKLKINLINKDYDRITEQKNQLELILDHSSADNIYFEYDDFNEIGLGMYCTWTRMTFKFTINK